MITRKGTKRKRECDLKLARTCRCSAVYREKGQIEIHGGSTRRKWKKYDIRQKRVSRERKTDERKFEQFCASVLEIDLTSVTL